MVLDDTIAAIASAPGGAYRGLVRMSGPHVVACLAKCFRAASDTSLHEVRRPRVLSGQLRLAASGRELPGDLLVWPSTRSYTRQPAAEFHTIGSPPLLGAALDTICGCGARLAEPGEFTMRAFLAGRLDLTQAEAVLGVIDATGRQQLDLALRQLAGGLAGPLGHLRNELLELLAHLEAGLDFVEEDIQFISPEQLLEQLKHASDAVAGLLAQMAARDVAAGEPRIVLIGRPNAGKSSLLNALAGDRAALVSGTPGTTRDYLACRLDLDGLACLLIDTAGIGRPGRPATVDTAAQQFTTEQAGRAQLRVVCIDTTRPPDDWERRETTGGGDEAPTRIVAYTKCDLPAVPRGEEGTALAKCHLSLRERAPFRGTKGDTALVPSVRTSSVTGEGLDELRRAIREQLDAIVQPESNVVAGTAARCRDSLRLAADALRRACGLASARLGEELVAAEVRGALTELGKVVGAVYTDDVLDRIFSRFCIGK